ncbi:kinase-like protein [Ceratobasidium sp. AG-I]|nr:kinase-like protein [Ceratobasidium sp. AG-I]
MFSKFFGSSRDKNKANGREREVDEESSRPVDDNDRAWWDVPRLIGYVKPKDTKRAKFHEMRKKLGLQLRPGASLGGVQIDLADPTQSQSSSSTDPYTPKQSRPESVASVKNLTQNMANMDVDPSNGQDTFDDITYTLLEECEIPMDWCRLLKGALAHATPEGFASNSVIQELRQNCIASRDIIPAQIAWATGWANPRAKEQLLKLLGDLTRELNDVLQTYDDTMQMTIDKREAEMGEQRQAEINLNLSAHISLGSPDHTNQRSDSQRSSSREEVVVPSNLSAPEMFQCLLEHGCADVSLRINPDRHSTAIVTGGSFGDIWKSELDDGTKVAIKCLRLHTIAEDGPKGLKRAAREIYMWSKAKHPNVHELMGVIIFKEHLGMVSMWMENGSLHGYIRENPGVDRYQLSVQVASGVSYLHSIRMVHGDIKALNILVSHDGVAKLSDFDHSILSNGTLVFSATTNVGGGTLRWMAPELLVSTEGGNIQTAVRTMKTDIYALGMTILEVMTGKVPYSEYLQDQGIIRALDRKEYPVRPKELICTNEQADAVWALLLECWDHDAVTRPGALYVVTSINAEQLDKTAGIGTS